MTKSTISKRKSVGAICQVCKSPDYILFKYTELDVPEFRCNSCKKIWQYGKDGGIYMENLGDEFHISTQKFLVKTGTTISKKFLKKGNKFVRGEWNDIYSIIIKRGEKSYHLEFNDSVINSKTTKGITNYDILSCLNIWDFLDFQDYCDNMGGDVNDKESKRIYNLICREERILKGMYTEEELNMLMEIY